MSAAAADLAQVKRAIARVEGTDDPSAMSGAPLGTAFFIGARYALSALHVVCTLEGPTPTALRNKRLLLNFLDLDHTTPVTIRHQDPLNDWVLLECDVAPNAAPIQPVAAVSKGAEWECFGYPIAKPDGLMIAGQVRDPLTRQPSPAAASGGASVDAVQLYCHEASGHKGLPLHGFSGAPCIVNGEAVGLMRSTLVRAAPGLHGRFELFTEGGTVFACPVPQVLQALFGLDARLRPPRGWQGQSTEGSDFLVITSSQEAGAAFKLGTVAQQAHKHLVKEFGLGLPVGMTAMSALQSDEDMARTVRALCKARVVVFDATGFEPAAMLLLGIRAVVRRGVTILSIGGAYRLGGPLEIPFNLQDANFVSHGSVQDEAGKDFRRVALLSSRIERGLRALDQSPVYADLPVFDALRQLPAHRREPRTPANGVLVLCSFKQAYSERNWDRSVKVGLDNCLDLLRREVQDQAELADPLGVARSLELKSPQLVSRAIYEEMRRAQACVVDLTGWSAAVLFELGVRLAVSRQRLRGLYERGSPFAPGLEAQCKRLLELFVPQEQHYVVESAPDEYTDPLNEPAFERVYGTSATPGAPGELAAGRIYNWVKDNIVVEAEPSARPPYRELLDSARLFARGSDKSNTPIGLYPARRPLTKQEDQAYFDRLLGAAMILHMSFAQDEPLLADAAARRAMDEAARALFADASMKDRMQKEVPALYERLNRLADQLSQPPDTGTDHV